MGDLNHLVESGSSTVDAVICVWIMSMLSLLCPGWDAWLVLAVSWSRQSGSAFTLLQASEGACGEVERVES